MTHKVSIFTSCYNYSKFLKKSIEGVLNQTYTNFEYFLFDNGSTDSTYEIMKEYEHDKRVTIIKLKDRYDEGLLMNISIKLSTGNYWSWSPADDYWCLNLLEEKVKYIEKYPKSILYDSFYYINSEGEVYNEHNFTDVTAEKFSAQSWTVCRIAFTGILIPMYVFNEKNIMFPEKLSYSTDFYWMMDAIVNKIPFNLVPQKLHYKRKHSNLTYSMSRKYRKEIAENVIKIRNEMKEKLILLENENFSNRK